MSRLTVRGILGHFKSKKGPLGANSHVAKPVECHEFSDVVTKHGFYWLLASKPAS